MGLLEKGCAAREAKSEPGWEFPATYHTHVPAWKSEMRDYIFNEENVHQLKDESLFLPVSLYPQISSNQQHFFCCWRPILVLW
jgi:hypothetical protein